MKRLLLNLTFLASVCAVLAAWASQLLWYSFGNITGGLNAIAGSCPKNPRASCAIGAIQFVMGVIGAAAGAYGTYFGAFKRDLDGSAVYHIHEKTKWPTRSFKRGGDLSDMLRQHNASVPAKIVYHHLDGSETVGLYHFNSETRMHHTFADMALTHNLTRREVVGGNDGYGGSIHDDDTATYRNVAHGRGDTNEWAQLAYDQMDGGNNDSVCMGMVDPDNNENVAVVRLQPATNGDYNGLNTNACNGHGFRKRQPIPESDGIICQELCVVTSGPKSQCLEAGGGCLATNGACGANLNQPTRACDGIVCGMRRQCD